MTTKNKILLRKYVIPTISIGWFIGLFFLGWWAVLWTFIGMAIGTIIRQLKENV